MKTDDALQLLHDANPAPDARSITTEVLGDRRRHAPAFLLATQEAQSMTQTTDTTPRTMPAGTPRWKPALAFAAVIAVAVIAAVSITSPSFDAANVPAAPFETAEDAAYAYVANVNGDGDWAGYQAMTTEDVVNGHLLTYGRPGDEKIRQRYDSLAAEGFTAEITNCPPTEARAIVCEGVITSGAFVASQGGTLEMTLLVGLSDAGLINNISLEPAQPGLLIGGDLYDWMHINHPETAEAFYDQLWGGQPLTRPVDIVVTDFLTAELQFIDTNK